MKLSERFNLIVEGIRAQMTTQIAYAFVVLISIIFFVIADQFIAFNKRIEKETERARGEHLNVMNILQSSKWQERFKESQKIKNNIEDRLWTANTPGIIAAEFQQVIERMTTEHSITSISIEVTPNESIVNGVKVLEYEIAGVAPPGGSMIEFFGDFANKKRIIKINTVEINFSVRDRLGTRFKVTGVLPVNLGVE